MKKNLNLLTALVLTALLLMGCSCSTKPKTGSLSGLVALVNDTQNSDFDTADFGGVTIALYEPAVLDSFLVRMNGAHPQIGVPLSQETDFDHRRQNPVKSTLSDATGQYSITELDPGDYVLSLMKEDWGFRYVFQVEIREGEEYHVGDVELFPARTLDAFITEDYTLESDHSYYIPGVTSFIGNVAIEPRARVYVDPSGSVKFYAAVETPLVRSMNDAWLFTTAEGMYSTVQVPLGLDAYFSSVEFLNSPVNIQNGIFQHVSNTVSLNTPYSQIDNVIIRYFGGGLSLSQGYANISNLIVANGSGNGIQISSNSTELTRISNCIISKANTGIRINTLGTFDIYNNYFHDNFKALIPSICTGSITHNAFDQNDYDIYQELIPDPVNISYNNFYLSQAWGILPHRQAIINNNNFYRTNGYFVWNRGAGVHNSYSSSDIDATNNYWGTPDIDQYIMDAGDNADYPNAPCSYYVIYLPKRSSVVPNAGIQ